MKHSGLNSRQVRGSKSEIFVSHWLEAHGWRVHFRNYWSAWGEIDLIAREKDCLVFLEVRYRSSSTPFSSAIESVDWKKQRRIIRTAHAFLRNHKVHFWEKQGIQEFRFDIVGLDGRNLEHLRNAFS